MVLRFGDGPAEPFLCFRPAFARQYRRRNPAHAKRIVVQRLQKGDGGVGADADCVEEIVSRRFNEALAPQEPHRSGSDDSLVSHARGWFAALAKHLHDVRPGARDELGVLGGKISFGHHQIHQGQADGLVLGLEDFCGFGFAAGMQACLLAGVAILIVKHLSASKESELTLHRAFHGMGTSLRPLASSVGWVAEQSKILPEQRALIRFTDTFTDS